MAEDYLWDLRNPDGAMLGMEFARAVSAAADVVLAHSLPERVDVVVRDGSGERVIARGEGLADEPSRPMARLVVGGGTVRRKNIWPSEEDLGRPVILPGGEVGLLREWWNAEDGTEWRWNVEFHNSV